MSCTKKCNKDKDCDHNSNNNFNYVFIVLILLATILNLLGYIEQNNLNKE